ncbi:MAG: SusC/RagA family TonB-linked outer membrane protein [Bacteroidales bacterium]
MRKFTLILSLCFVLLIGSAYAQKTVSGVVTDGNKEPLPGVTVVVKETSQGAITDSDGKYVLSTSVANPILVFSYIGFTSQEVLVENKSIIDIVLQETASELNEVVVTALGIRREQKSLGYAISKIDAQELTKVGSPNLGSALYGKAAGVKIQSSPGGSTGAVNINIRGINSISGSSQPLIVVDGVPIRNGEANNDGYWSDQKIRGNGMVDLNPEDIENLSILKGAAASALYGSEGANGVVVITTKSGKGAKKGLGVEVNITYSDESAAFLPNFQNKYGPGYDRGTNISSFGSDDDGWLMEDLNNDGTAETYRPIYRSYAQFGPAFDGRDVIGWDNKIHPYVAKKNNFKDLFQSGHTGIYNVAVTQNSEKSNFRLSLTHLNSEDVNISGPHNKTTLNINGSIKIHETNNLNFVASNIYQHTNNRPEKINRLTNSYSGFFSRFDDIQWYYDMYKTSDGYKYVNGKDQPSTTPNENIVYPFRATDLLDYIWKTKEDQYDEYSNRTMVSVTDTQQLLKGLSLRGRLGIDYTGMRETTKSRSTKPLSIEPTGGFSQKNTTYTTLYGDAMLNYNHKFDNKIGINFGTGLNARDESNFYTSASTKGGLTVENWFSLNASANENLTIGKETKTKEWHRTTFGYFGTGEVSYDTWLFLNLTGRYEKFSTMPTAGNSTFYPSISTSFILNEAFSLPDWINFSKLRVSYGEVGVPAEPYTANIVYSQGTLNGTTYSYLDDTYGNESLKPERKKEFEIGLENSFLKNRLGFELTYYSSRIIDQILTLSLPESSGFKSTLANIGELQNHGVEVVLRGTPIKTNNWQWDLNATFSFNRNKVKELMPGIDEIVHSNWDGDAALLVSRVGHSMGDFYAYEPYKDANGNNIIGNDGYYKMNFDERKLVGNVNPDVVGGLQNNLSYKNWNFSFALDYKIGGDIMSMATHYRTGSGFFESTLQYRDAENGGAAYYINSENIKIATDASKGPNGEKIYNDGVILQGVTEEGKVNDVIIDAASYYLDTYGWGGPQYNAHSYYSKSIYENSYIKFREASLTYTLPQKFVSKLGLQDVSLTAFGRNLFYIWKTLPHSDPETTLGTKWIRNAVDEGSGATTRSFGFSLRTRF